jgi:hypothetical protein
MYSDIGNITGMLAFSCGIHVALHVYYWQLYQSHPVVSIPQGQIFRISSLSQWRRQYSNQLYKLYIDRDVLKTVKAGQLRWAICLDRMNNGELSKM